MLLWMAGEYRHPRQQAMIAEHMFASGFGLAARDRALNDLDELKLRLNDLDELKLRLGKLDELVRDERNSEWATLYDEVDEIVELAKSAKGGGE
jgi:hypothetical protein